MLKCSFYFLLYEFYIAQQFTLQRILHNSNVRSYQEKKFVTNFVLCVLKYNSFYFCKKISGSNFRPNTIYFMFRVKTSHLQNFYNYDPSTYICIIFVFTVHTSTVSTGISCALKKVD